ncbi:MAG: class B sortase [Candidatus Saccharibacteria bacterium]|nr:class B sortase [Candidatus Saccharibacteria bacterium]
MGQQNKQRSNNKYHGLTIRKHKIKRWLWVSLIVFVIITLIAAALIVKWYLDGRKAKELSQQASSTTTIERPASANAVNVNPPENKEDDYWRYIKMDMLSVDFNELLAKNSDTVGWIKINGTSINYPIVQTTDNKYYLKHSFDKSGNGAGWIFADYRDNMTNFGRNTIIYGHARLDTIMFGSLKNILTSNWYNNKDNYIVKLSTPTSNTMWQVFSVYSIPAESYYIQTDFTSDQQFGKFIQVLKNRSEANFTANVNASDKILTLSTCHDTIGLRVVMHAKLIKQEPR